ncbi:MAG: hypothetical protein HYZ74_03840 [Elusimicrobia bacterium]|nr:hypothetical protein [Elusimicrobiota bacterium]
MIIPALFLASTLAAAARAAQPAPLPAFNFVDLNQLRAQAPQVAEPASKAADVIDRYHMAIQAGKDALYGYAKTPEEFAESTSYWSGVLKDAGVEPGVATYKDGFYTLPYHAADGRVIREFTAEPRQFPPKDEPGLRANMALARESLNKAGLTPVSSRVLNLDALLATYSILYLTKADAAPEHETRLRVLQPGDDLDLDIIRVSGVTTVQVPEPWMVVYIGPELGFVSMAGRTLDEAQLKLRNRKNLLIGYGKNIFGETIYPTDDPEWKFAADLYFFQ